MESARAKARDKHRDAKGAISPEVHSTTSSGIRRSYYRHRESSSSDLNADSHEDPVLQTTRSCKAVPKSQVKLFLSLYIKGLCTDSDLSLTEDQRRQIQLAKSILNRANGFEDLPGKMSKIALLFRDTN